MQHAIKARQSNFAPDPERRVMIAKIHVAKKEMQLLDDDYRAMLIEVTGRSSSADCTIAELRAMIEAMKRKGFQPRKANGAADHPFALKARAMWISLHHLGAIDNPSEQALEAFARRQLGCMKMQWANQAQGYKLVEALKAIAERNGWSQKVTSTRGLRPIAADVALRILKVRLVERIYKLLAERRVIPLEMPLGRAAFQLAGMERDGPVPLWDLGDLDLLAKAFGEKLREAGK
jgi:phage gp16-like protein